MSSLLQCEKVQLVCTCRRKAPITNLYFCKHCLKLRCRRCVSHEVDSYSCPNCLENNPSAEAKVKKNRCSNCLECPCCKHSLTTRATSMAIQDPNDPSRTTTKKIFYLACALCRWTSRDVGLQDRDAASGGWEDRENPHASRIDSLVAYYHQLAIREKTEIESKKYTKRRTYMRLQERLFSPSPSARRRSLLNTLAGLSPRDTMPGEMPSIDVMEPTDDVDPLPPKLLTEPLILENVTTLSQRVNIPERNSPGVDTLYPVHKHLVVKRSQRCRECEHNLCKPEYNPSSIKFKIQLTALHLIPDVRVFLTPKLQFERESVVTILISNPLADQTRIRLEENNDCPDVTASVQVPTDELLIAGKEITADFEDRSHETGEYEDKPDVVQFRSGHKLGVLFRVTPQRAVGDVTISFFLNYTYKNTSPALRSSVSDEPKNDEEVSLRNEVWVHVGSVELS